MAGKFGTPLWQTSSTPSAIHVTVTVTVAVSKTRGLTNFITGQKTVWDAIRRTSCGQTDRLVGTDRQTHTDRQTVTVTVMVYSSGQTVTVKPTDMCTCVNAV